MIFKVALIFLLVGQPPPSGQPPSQEKPAAGTVEAGKATQPEAQVQAGGTETGQKQTPTTQQPSQGRLPSWFTWVILLGVLVVFYLLMILPQRRRQKKHQEMLKSLQRGDKIVTSSGIIGTIARVKEGSLILKTAEKTEIEIDKSVVSERK